MHQSNPTQPLAVPGARSEWRAGGGRVFGATVATVLSAIPTCSIGFVLKPLNTALRTRPLSTGWRVAPPGDIVAMVDAISAVSHLALAPQASIADLEVNPVLVLPEGHGVDALDAVIRPVSSGAGGT